MSIEKARFKEIPSNYRKLTAEQIEQINRAPVHSGLICPPGRGRPAGMRDPL